MAKTLKEFTAAALGVLSVASAAHATQLNGVVPNATSKYNLDFVSAAGSHSGLTRVEFSATAAENLGTLVDQHLAKPIVVKKKAKALNGRLSNGQANLVTDSVTTTLAGARNAGTRPSAKVRLMQASAKFQ